MEEEKRGTGRLVDEEKTERKTEIEEYNENRTISTAMRKALEPNPELEVGASAAEIH
jgi:hypothetical protein